MSQAFYRKWRPKQWDEVVSQEHIINTLRNAVRSGRFGHAYLLAGPRGTGKTTTARLLAKALNCLDENPEKRPCDACEHCISINEGRFLDLIEIDAASNTSVEDVRDLRDKINFSPSQGRFKVYIIDEVHMLSTAAFNALLKTLEEPPPHAIFVLATTEVHKIPATILSRCQRYEFRRIPVTEIAKHLKAKAAEEGIEVDDEALTLIARQATGAMRDAISLLDQLSSTGGRVTLKEAQEVLGTAASALVVELVDAVLAKDAGTGMKLIQTALDGGTDARQFARQVVDYLRNVLLVKMGNAEQVDATREARQQMSGHAKQFDTPRLLEAVRAFNAAAVDSRSAWHPGLALELAVAESVEEKAPAAHAEAAQSGAAQYVPVAQTAPVQQAQAQQTSSQAAPAAQPPEFRPRGAESTQRSEAPAQRGADSSQRSEAPAQRGADSSQRGAEQAARGKPQAAPEQAEPAPSAAPAGAGGRQITQQDLQQNWRRVLDMVKKRNPLTQGLLNSCRPSIKENTLVLSFQSEVVKSKMDTSENLDIVRQAIQAIMGAGVAVRCIVTGSRTASSNDLDVDGDGIVGTALDLGGVIVHEDQ